MRILDFTVVRIVSRCLAVSAMTAAFMSAGTAQAQAPRVVRGTVSQSYQQVPLLSRPNRVGHVYGNTVRRLYYISQPTRSRNATWSMPGVRTQPIQMNALPIQMNALPIQSSFMTGQPIRVISQQLP